MNIVEHTDNLFINFLPFNGLRKIGKAIQAAETECSKFRGMVNVPQLIFCFATISLKLIKGTFSLLSFLVPTSDSGGSLFEMPDLPLIAK